MTTLMSDARYPLRTALRPHNNIRFKQRFDLTIDICFEHRFDLTMYIHFDIRFEHRFDLTISASNSTSTSQYSLQYPFLTPLRPHNIRFEQHFDATILTSISVSNTASTSQYPLRTALRRHNTHFNIRFEHRFDLTISASNSTSTPQYSLQYSFRTALRPHNNFDIRFEQRFGLTLLPQMNSTKVWNAENSAEFICRHWMQALDTMLASEPRPPPCYASLAEPRLLFGKEGLVNCLYATCSRCRNSCKANQIAGFDKRDVMCVTPPTHLV